ncbi:MAG: hypothetical protein IKQ67_03415 [Candidatus Methanomethylophilaceae archaeon]|nr:hypothetical protein [Candidatus Methanomethylophilaceae archaeon]
MNNKSKKLLTIILLMPIFAVVLWYMDAAFTEELSDIDVIIPIIVMALGSLISLRAMKDSVSDVMAVQTLFFGLYLLARGISDILYDHSMISPGPGFVQIVIGIPLIFMGLALWLKMEISIAGIRNIILIFVLLAICKAILFNHQPMDLLISETGVSLMVVCMSVCILIISQDKSISTYSFIQASVRSLEGMEMRMSSVDDAYILSSGAGELRQMLDSGSTEPVRLRLYSNKHGERQIAFKRGDKGVRMEIFTAKQSMSNPYYQITVQDIVIMQDHLSVYAADGNWFRILVYDSKLPNYDNALILGHEVDLRKYANSFSRMWLLRKNRQKKEEAEQMSLPAANYYPVQNGMPPQGQEIRNPDGSVYRGMLDERGLFTGPGVYFYPNGDRFEGVHVGGVRNGPGCYYWADGSWTRSNYTNGVRGGPTTMFTARDGFLYEGIVENDRFVGNIRISREGRPVYEGGCDDTRPYGNGILYVDGGRIIGQWNPDGTCVGTFHGQDGSAMPTDPGMRYI